MFQEAGHIKNRVALMNLVNSKVAWVLVPSGNQVQPQITLDLGYLLDYLSASYDCA